MRPHLNRPLVSPAEQARLDASLAKFQRRTQEATARLAAKVPHGTDPTPVPVATESPIVATPPGAPLPGPSGSPGEVALTLNWTQQRWGMTRKLVSNRIGGAIYVITREEYDEAIDYHCWRQVGDFSNELEGSPFSSSFDGSQEQTLIRAKAACINDAAIRTGRK